MYVLYIMDNEVNKTKGRKPSKILNEDDLNKQKKGTNII